MASEILVFSGNANVPLANRICQFLQIPLGQATVGQFSDGETRVEIQCNVRGRHVFIVQPTSSPVNNHVMELLVMVDALRRASADRITAVIPYYGYGRQERKTAPRTPITAKLIADLLEVSGIDRVVSLELHMGAVQGFFSKPVDHLFSKPVFYKYLSQQNIENPIIVSPDAGGVERARALAKVMGCGLAIVDKRRDRAGDSKVMHIIGDVEGKTAILIDDICDTAGSLTQAAEELKQRGASRVLGAVTHAVLSGPAIDRLMSSCIETLFVTDTILLHPQAQKCPKIHVMSVAELLAEAIKRIHNLDSVSNLFI